MVVPRLGGKQVIFGDIGEQTQDSHHHVSYGCVFGKLYYQEKIIKFQNDLHLNDWFTDKVSGVQKSRGSTYGMLGGQFREDLREGMAYQNYQDGCRRVNSILPM